MKLKNENKLMEDELEQVAGGGYDDHNLADDSRYLNVLLQGRAGKCGRYGDWTVMKHCREVVKAWDSVGVECYQGADDWFHYKINGKEVRQYDAWLHAEQVVGKHLKRADWDW